MNKFNRSIPRPRADENLYVCLKDTNELIVEYVDKQTGNVVYAVYIGKLTADFDVEC